MNQQTAELLEKLATKLGTTSEYLWKVLIKQAPISATTTLFQTLLVVAFGVVLYKLHKRFSEPKDKYENSLYEDSSNLQLVMGVLTFIFVILAITSFFFIEDVINGYFNPEYWALDRILHSLGK